MLDNPLPKKKILLVEDEPHLAFTIEYNLQAEGYDVIPAVNGLIALEKFRNHGPFDLIILDVMLPELDGFKVAKAIRKDDNKTGILMLTARSSECDVITGLETGADDYMTKPFHLKEFLLRVRRMAARSELFSPAGNNSECENTMYLGNLSLDLESMELSCPRGKFNLTVLEANVLKEFLKSPGKILSREHLLTTVWGVKGQMETRTVDNFILRLRKYIETDPSKPSFIESVRGRGYRLNLPEKIEADASPS
ncbi:MAG: response regulator transcription factor [Oligoflexales bacterium]|nr:response regulator transcription factor [Oligoflexales bacterium]